MKTSTSKTSQKTFVVETWRRKVLFESEKMPMYLFSLPLADGVRRIYEASKSDLHEFNHRKEQK